MAAEPPDPESLARLLRARVGRGVLELPVFGVSMSGVIPSGSTVMVEAGERPRVGEIWAFVEDDGQVVVHRVREVSVDTVICRGSGNQLDDPPLPRSRIIGQVRRSTDPSGRPRSFGRIDRIRAAVSFVARRTARRFI